MHRARALALLVAVWFLLVAGLARAGTDESADDGLYDCAKAKGQLTVSLKPDVELKDLVTWAMGFTCKKFLYASSLAQRSSKVTVMTPGTMSTGDAWSVFETALAGMGLAVVKKGKVLEIVESASAKDEALAVLKEFPDGGADVVRLLLRPEHVSVDDLKGALELVKSSHGVVASLANLHAILVTDDATHIARMKPLVDELDQPSTGSGVYAIPLQHADAEQLAATVKTLLGDDKAQTRLVADARLNALFVAGSDADYLRVRALAKAIDIDAGDTAQLHMVKLRYAQAKDVIAAVQPMLGEAKVAADEASNAILVMASARDAAALQAVVEEMDVPRRQVYLEALILEVDAGNNVDVDTAWHLGKPHGTSTIVGAQNGSKLSTLDVADTLKNLTGAAAGIVGKSITVLGQTIPSFGVLVQATHDDARLDVLSSPHMMTLDNQKASISVGSNIPYKSSSGGASLSGGTLPENISRQPVNLTLEVTPHITVGDEVRLDVKLDDSEIGTEDFGGLGPTWKTRTLETSVMLKDQESIVLGGMVEERIDNEVTGIPGLMDIPVLGYLFRQTKRHRHKANLLVILTPHLIDDSVDGRRVLEARMRERDEFLRAASDLEDRVLQPDLDYRKKRGLVAEIDAVVEQVEQDRAALEAAAAAPKVPEGRVDQ